MNDEILKLYENKFMFRQAMRLAKDVDRAHDLVQDTMIRLMDNANKYTASQGTPAGFVLVVMRRIHYNNVRRVGIINRGLETYAAKQDNPTHDATDYVYCRQLIKRSKYREILKHKALGYTTQDISKIMGINKNTIFSRTRYMREELVKLG